MIRDSCPIEIAAWCVRGIVPVPTIGYMPALEAVQLLGAGDALHDATGDTWDDRHPLRHGEFPAKLGGV